MFILYWWPVLFRTKNRGKWKWKLEFLADGVLNRDSPTMCAVCRMKRPVRLSEQLRPEQRSVPILGEGPGTAYACSSRRHRGRAVRPRRQLPRRLYRPGPGYKPPFTNNWQLWFYCSKFDLQFSHKFIVMPFQTCIIFKVFLTLNTMIL